MSGSGVAFSIRDRFDFGSDEYRGLFARSDASAFGHPDWLDPFYAVMAPALDALPLVVEGRDRTGELVLVAPLLRRILDGVEQVEFASLGVTDYAAPIVASNRVYDLERDRDVPRRFREAVGTSGSMLVRPVRAEALGLWRMLFDAEIEALPYGAHAVAFGAPYPAWRRASFGRARADGLDRKAQRLGHLGTVRLEVVAGEEITAALATAASLRRGRFDNDPLQEPHGLAFYTEVALRGAASGLTRTYRLCVGGETAAILFGLIDGNSFLYLLLAADYLRFGRFSPGLLALDRVMADWADRGGTIFDFTIGDEPFKTGFGAGRSAMFALKSAGSAAAGDI